jgi:large subunit ribosomal protein L25
MAREQVTISAESRTETGSNAARRLRRDGWLPCNLNTSDGQALTLKMNRHDFGLTVLRSSAHMFEVATPEGAKTALLRDVQMDPITGAALHADFVEVSLTQKVRVNVPIVTEGDPPGVEEGGVFETPMTEVEVECQAGSIPDSLALDVSGLGMNDALHVSELPLPDGVVALSSAESVLAMVSPPRLEEEPEEAEEGEGEEAAEGAAEGEGEAGAAGDEAE